MTLTFGKSDPAHMLQKAKRDLARLQAAESAGDTTLASDALFDVAVTLTAVRDWLMQQPGASFTQQQVKKHADASAELESMRDLANAGKHRVITKYQPTTDHVDSSAAPEGSWSNELNSVDSRQAVHLKIVSKGQSRSRASEVAAAAIKDWEGFIATHAGSPT